MLYKTMIFSHFHMLKVHHVTFVLLLYRRKSAFVEYDVAQLGNINKNRYNCKDNLSTRVIKYRISKILMCKMFFIQS